METEFVLSLGDQRWTLPAGADTITIGRASNADIRLQADDQISRIHARLTRDAATWTLHDESRNGTGLNGHRLTTPTPLTTGDRIHIGRSVLTFHKSTLPTPNASNPPAPPTTPADDHAAHLPDASPQALPPTTPPVPAPDVPAAAPAHPADEFAPAHPADEFAPAHPADEFAPAADVRRNAPSASTPYPADSDQAFPADPAPDVPAAPVYPADEFAPAADARRSEPSASTPYRTESRQAFPADPGLGSEGSRGRAADGFAGERLGYGGSPDQPAAEADSPYASTRPTPEAPPGNRAPNANPFAPDHGASDANPFTSDDRASDANPFTSDDRASDANPFVPGNQAAASPFARDEPAAGGYSPFAPDRASDGGDPVAPDGRSPDGAGQSAPEGRSPGGGGRYSADEPVADGRNPFASDSRGDAGRGDEYGVVGLVPGFEGRDGRAGDGWAAYPSADNPEPVRSPWEVSARIEQSEPNWNQSDSWPDPTVASTDRRTKDRRSGGADPGVDGLPGADRRTESQPGADRRAQGRSADGDTDGADRRTSEGADRLPGTGEDDAVGTVRLGRVLIVAGGVIGLGLVVNLIVTFLSDGPGSALRWLVPPGIALIVGMALALADAAAPKPHRPSRLDVSVIVAIVVVLVGVGVGGFALTAGTEYVGGYLTGNESGEDRLIKPVSRTASGITITVENVTYTGHFTRIEVAVANAGKQPVTIPLDGTTFTAADGTALRADTGKSSWPSAFPAGGTEHGTVTFKSHLPDSADTAVLTFKPGSSTFTIPGVALSK
ncbi:FHA domain-containing protein [Kribbella sp. HUAS MG21]|uniref:FHA domain-containing protein n=1 Tax=Kribbella sp. HUAS MG21 TaxID=3160966 RepID=A0AAU7TET7_9ACTN